jgi:choline-glycine betaine transporter
MTEDREDNIEEFESKETAGKLPVGWLILFWGLIAWGVYYFVAYTPAISGWSQGSAYEESVKE